ncbi:DUF935 family protein [Helicobacter muridarum]|nr:DUF935 family protein [Helicobacter muridarum]
MNDIPASINYKQVKNALQNQSLSEVISTFEFFKRFDTQISSEINKRKTQVTRLPFIIKSSDEAQNTFLKDFITHRDFRKILFDCASSIPYGFSAFLLNWQSKEGKILPKLDYINHRYFESDEFFNTYIEQGGNRIYLHESEDIFTLYHPSDSGNIIESSLMNKIISLASLKHIAISRYMSYLDSFAVPPLIIKSEALTSKETSDMIMSSALKLRSNGVGLFSQNDILEVLNGNVDKGTFLEFIRYCDEAISKVITGQVLAGNSVQNGTQALGSVHENITRNVLEYDANILAENIMPLLHKTLSYNFANVAAFRFELDTNTEKDEKLQAEVYSMLSNMGIKIPLQHLEKTFKIEGLEYRDMQGFPVSTIEERLGSVAHNSLQDKKSQKEHNKTTTYKQLPLTELDRALESLKPKDSFDIESLLKDCLSFEEAQKKIFDSFSGEELLIKEQELMAYMLQANLYGMQQAGAKGINE